MSVVTLTASYRVVTPLFCGGAEPTKSELRIPSFKGVLRWWWRALAWSRLDGDLEKIWETEQQIFGGVKTGQSRVVLALGERPQRLERGRQRDSRRGVKYLGYGLIDTREHLRTPFEFTVRLRCRGLDDPQISLLKDALKALGLMGGMGSRSRRGWGSLTLKELTGDDGKTCWQAPASDRLEEELKAFLPTKKIPFPPYTAFSNKSRIILFKVTKNGAHPLDLLNLIGEKLRDHSDGRKGKLPMPQSSAKGQANYPEQVVFGLPRNSGYGWIKPKQYERRASPLLIHIHQADSEPVGVVLTFLPSVFLPEEDGCPRISVGGKEVCLQDAGEDGELWEPIKVFLDRMLDLSRRGDDFGEVIEVKAS